MVTGTARNHAGKINKTRWEVRERGPKLMLLKKKLRAWNREHDRHNLRILVIRFVLLFDLFVNIRGKETMHMARGHCLTHCDTCQKFDVLNRPTKLKRGNI